MVVLLIMVLLLLGFVRVTIFLFLKPNQGMAVLLMLDFVRVAMRLDLTISLHRPYLFFQIFVSSNISLYPPSTYTNTHSPPFPP